MQHAPALLALLPAVLAASLGCASTSAGEGGAAPPRAAAPAARSGALTGVVVPAAAEAIALWPEAFSGELVVLSVEPHGSRVAAGAVVCELDPRRLADALADAEHALRSARVRHAGLLETHRVAAEAAAARLARAEASLDRARRALAAWSERERALARRADELARRREAAREEDQQDELEQLEAMYAADELVDATEEIVLKRQRRDVALTEAAHGLSADRRALRLEVDEALAAEARREAVAREALELEHLRATLAVEAAARADAAARSAAELAEAQRDLERLRRDRELCSVRAPRAGLLLHGSRRSLRSAGGEGRLERGSKLAPRTEVLVVADPARTAVALDVPETRRAELADGARVVVRPLGTDRELAGTLSLAGFPRGARGDESTFEATVALDADAEALVPGTHATVEPAGAGR